MGYAFSISRLCCCQSAQDILRYRGGYVWQGVPDALGSYGQRKTVPDNWRGLSGDELRKATGVPTAVFCHHKGFAGSAETLEDAILFAAKAIET
ncbi:hypothetical protein GMI69_07655 [Eggerthellaceae bacterium zg-887]|uniref:MYG1 family protein n=1 Tax=Xiamenia xianingshaonis TaxID=2682776 RepID=UPI0019F6A06B|nr:MYG1 family protein [Xiamenia xianingshaonis]NHM16529.1 hypothetical protein [Xiamenia xianingshaonis]